ncbi:hypothetical protein A2U01_0081738, partial [Trifolium medium]|nr:hypothetical protein [Trifolium medium]
VNTRVYFDDICYVVFAGEDMLMVKRLCVEEDQPQELEPYPDMLTVRFWI